MNVSFETLKQRVALAKQNEKKQLTSEQIEELCSLIPMNPNIPFETAVLVQKGLIKTLRDQLTDIKIYPEGYKELKRSVEDDYHRSLLQPGEMVGVQAATSIGEPVSQMTLNAFHYSGISSIGVAAGVPRVEELLNASKKPKSCLMNLFFLDKLGVEAVRKEVFKNITEVYMTTVISHIEILYFPSLASLTEEDKTWYELYRMMCSSEVIDEEGHLAFGWCVRLHLNRTKMVKHSVSCMAVAEKIENSFRDLYTVPFPDNIGKVDVFIDFNSIKMKKKEEQDIEILAGMKEIRCIHNVIIPYIKDILISGIKGVEDVYIREEKGEWVVDTRGTNLYAAFSNEGLDYTRCRSSDIWEIWRVLGVEATRCFIIEEFYKVLATSGASVGRRHIELLADSMTFQGKINSVNRYGIDRNQNGPIAKACFEESVKNFFIASVNGETDEMGVSSSLIGGKLVKCGTGYMDLVLDTEMVKKAIPLPEFVYPERKKLETIPEKPKISQVVPEKSSQAKLLTAPTKPKKAELGYVPAPPLKMAKMAAVQSDAVYTPAPRALSQAQQAASVHTMETVSKNEMVPGLKSKKVVEKSASRTKKVKETSDEKKPVRQSFMKKPAKKKDVIINFEEDL